MRMELCASFNIVGRGVANWLRLCVDARLVPHLLGEWRLRHRDGALVDLLEACGHPLECGAELHQAVEMAKSSVPIGFWRATNKR